MKQALAIAAVILFSAPGFTQQRAAEPVSLVQVSTGLYEILGGRGARGGVFVYSGGVCVIDAKMDKTSVDETIARIADLTDAPIRYLIDTHSDGDHVNGNRFYPESTVIVAHENCRREFFHPTRDGSASEWNDPSLAAFVPEITFSDKLTLHTGKKTVELYYFGVGHSTGDIVVYFPASKTAFVGDQIRMTNPQLIHSYKGGNSFAHVKTLERMLATLDARTFLSGHDNPVGRNDILDRIGVMKQRQAKVRAARSQGETLEQCQALFPENERTLVETIWAEIAEGRDKGK